MLVMDLDDLSAYLAGTDLGDPTDFHDVDDEGEPVCPDWTEEALDALPFDPYEVETCNLH